MEDLDGCKLKNNMKAMSKLVDFRTTRMHHAMNMAVDVSGLHKHPVTWGFLKDSSLILHFTTYAHGTRPNLDRLIKTRGADGKPNWAADLGIIEDILEVKKGKPSTTYDYGRFRELLRYVRNKIARYVQGHENLRRRSPHPRASR